MVEGLVWILSQPTLSTFHVEKSEVLGENPRLLIERSYMTDSFHIKVINEWKPLSQN